MFILAVPPLSPHEMTAIADTANQNSATVYVVPEREFFGLTRQHFFEGTLGTTRQA